RGQRAGAAAELTAENCFGQASVAVLLSFPQADDGSNPGFQRHQGLFGYIVVGLAEELTAFGMANDDVAATRFSEHRGRDFSREGAFLAPGNVLASDGDAGAFGGLDGRGDCGERWGDDD